MSTINYIVLFATLALASGYCDALVDVTITNAMPTQTLFKCSIEGQFTLAKGQNREFLIAEQLTDRCDAKSGPLSLSFVSNKNGPAAPATSLDTPGVTNFYWVTKPDDKIGILLKSPGNRDDDAPFTFCLWLRPIWSEERILKVKTFISVDAETTLVCKTVVAPAPNLVANTFLLSTILLACWLGIEIEGGSLEYGLQDC
ncbi:hypothetical protein VNO77_05117 [Canavalia gladiata]|uniref:Uncharacterized protein n=1 Tax=Canavalia gladiata TaxID=3824 RepID=A0AAN9N2Y0_CANGL